jgi:hypothetical protein
LGGAVRQVDPQLVHDRDDFGVDVRGGCGAGRERVVVAGGVAFEERLAYSGAAGVLAADKQDGAHDL